MPSTAMAQLPDMLSSSLCILDKQGQSRNRLMRLVYMMGQRRGVSILRFLCWKLGFRRRTMRIHLREGRGGQSMV